MTPAGKLGAVQLLALGCVGIVMGAWLKKKFPLFDRLCIPTSIVGGMVFALLALAFHARQINFEVDTTLRDVMMVAFMTGTTTPVKATASIVSLDQPIEVASGTNITVGTATQNPNPGGSLTLSPMYTA